jgi:phage tail-like protein
MALESDASVQAGVSVDASASARLSAEAGPSASAGLSASVGGSAGVGLAGGVSLSAGTGQPIDAYPVCRFYVKIGGVFQAVFTEVGGLNAEMDVHLQEEGGSNTLYHRLPGRMKPSNLTLKHGIARSGEFFQWFMNVASGRSDRRHVSVILYDVAGKPRFQWDFLNAFPFRWSCGNLRADSDEIAIESLEIAYESMQLNGVNGLSVSLTAGANASLDVSGSARVNVSASASLGLR